MEPLTAIPDEKAMEELEEAKVALEIAKKQAPDESQASERDKLIEEIDDLKKRLDETVGERDQFKKERDEANEKIMSMSVDKETEEDKFEDLLD